MAATLPNGSVDIIKIINKGIPVRKWIRDSWARKKITEIQQRIANIVVPTKTSQLQNDSGFITSADVPPGSTASSTTPLMDGAAAVGTENAFARGDHRHPTDISRQAALSTAQMAAVNSGVTAAKVAEWDGITVPTKTSELTNDSGYITSAAVPTETSDLVNDSGFITAADIPAIPSKTSDLTNDSGFITASSVPSAYASNPLMDGTASAGSSTAWARGDHRHPTDTSRQAALSTAQLAAVNSGVTAEKVQKLDGLTVPTKTSDLTNDSDFQTETEVANAISAEAGLMVPYGYCTIAAGTVAKTVTVSPAVTALTAGLCIAVKFQYANTATNPTLNVNGLGAKAIKRYGTTAAGTSAAANWNANSVVILVYDGTYWMLADWNNTTYSGMTDAEYQAGTSTTNRLITPARLKAAVELHAPVQSVNGATGDVTVTVPTKTSELTNDSGFLTSAPVTSVNGQTGVVSLDAADVGALPDSTVIPSKTSQLTNDSGYITSVPVTSVNGKTGAVNLNASDVGALPDSTVIPSVPSPSTATPKMDGTASAGSSAAWSRGDHVHPHDTSKQDALTTAQLAAVNSGITAENLAVNDASVLCPVTPIVPTLDAGSHHATYGGCWYYKIGHHVCVHIGVASITANTTTTLWQMPAGYIPYSGIAVNGQGSGYNNVSRARVTGTGAVIVNSTQAYATAYMEYDAFS